jgi:SAM-dependent methyltransferase
VSSEPGTVKRFWNQAFDEQIARQAYNTAPVEAVVRTVAYYLRDRFSAGELRTLNFLEVGCGAGPNLIWLAQKGIGVSGVDISSTALELARENLEKANLTGQIRALLEAPAGHLPFDNESFDGLIEACVFQHLARNERAAAFAEVSRVLKPGGVFVGYMLADDHSIFRAKQSEQLSDDPGTLMLAEGRSNLYLTNLGICHFYRRQEVVDLLRGFSIVDPCLTTYYLPAEEARKRGYDEYLQSMWTVYAIK